ncbi:MAG: hypothetical protein V2I67_15890 [Thermoanaerobaculales bacterium]|nr:hypothetical protein [Thermoanaerobaculales bacterium]
MFIRRLLLFVLVAAAVNAAGSETEPVLELEVSPTSVRVGDPVEVMASARGGDELLWGELAVALEPGGAWELIGGPTAVPGVRPPAWTLELAPMETGEQELPTITVAARNVDGEVAEVGSANPPAVEVVSVLSGEEGDTAPAPVRDPIGVRGLPWEWILPLCAVLLPLMAAAAWWWRGRGRSDAGAVPALPPLAELEALAAELAARIGREPAEGVCDRLAAGLRRYLERRTGEPAEEMTSFELRLLARRRGWPEATQRLVQQVMMVADGVRFGRRPVADGELERAVDMALEAGRGVESFFAPPESSDDAVEAGG